MCNGVGLRGVILVVMALCAASPALGQQRRGAEAAEVVFIGANHNLTFLHPGFSPAHLRALLSAVGPAAICLEIPPDWSRAEGIPTYPQEQYAAMTWAERAGVPMYGVDWNSARTTAPAVVRMSDSVPLAERGEHYDRFRSNHLATVQWTAARAFDEVAEDLEAVQQNMEADSTAWAERDDSIAANIRAVAVRYAGRRIAVVYGRGHYGPIKRRLESAGIQVMTSQGYFPLDEDRVRDDWSGDDLIVLLGTNLDDWRTIAYPQSRNHQRTKELLDRLRREQPASVPARYFEARWRMLLGDLDSSRIALSRIAEEPSRSGVRYQADPRWSWPPFRFFEQKARYYVAIAHDLAGDREAAVAEYRRLLNLTDDELVVPAFIGARKVDLRPFLESFLRLPYRGGLLEAYRASLALTR